MHNSQEVAKKIKEMLRAKNLTAKDMLKSCDLSINTLSSMQSGGYYPRLEAITKIAEYLNCSVDYLLGRQNFSISPDIEKKNNAIADIVLRLRSDAELLSIVEDLSTLPSEKLQAVKTLISVIKK